MEIVAAQTQNSGSPFHNHDVREWSRLDSLTGVLERARLETDHWTANTATTSHKYNKVVDSRARSGADGNVQQQARRQFEVFQSKVPGGRLQVIKTQTVSSSRWTNNSSPNNNNTSTSITNNTNTSEDESRKNGRNDFEDLQLSLNPLDLTSEKSKASVGRSVGRRPPSRSRIRDDILSTRSSTASNTILAATNLQRVSRLCHQIHDSAVKRGSFGAQPINERQNGDGVEIHEISDTHHNLTRTKSTSSEDLPDFKKSLEDLEDLNDLQSWRRTSKIRRSLQYPKLFKPTINKPPDLPVNIGSVRKIREDLETGRRLSTALRGNNVDLDALDQILKSISNSSVSSNYEEAEKDQITAKKQKLNSFVTVESIQAVRDRLRRTSSPPIEDIYNKKDDEGIDDLMLNESTVKLSDMSSNSESRVKSYVYGMENDNKKPVPSGTGSLESRSKINNNHSVNRNEDWFSRRKSYGFEQMHNPDSTISSKNKNRIESSTDSGICRSTEIVLVPTPTKSNVTNYNDYTSGSDEEIKQVFREDNDIKTQVNGGSSVKKYSLLFESKRSDPYSSKKAHEELTTIWNKRGFNKDKPSEQPFEAIKSEPNWNGDVIKRHSIAVDETKYMHNKLDNKFKRTSLATNDKHDEEDDSILNKKHNKKVEFCKTEVHFAADSGRVNIVETDDKPPPTHNFRRRRRNTGMPEDYNKNGLPMLHFGDTSYEKSLFADTDTTENGESIYENINKDKDVIACGNVTVNVNGNYQQGYDSYKDNIEETPRGILKNKPIKPKPYILGDTDDLLRSTDSENEKTWGVRLRPTKEEVAPIWRSTVTVRNTSFEQNENIPPPPPTTETTVTTTQPEFQKLLKQLRPTSSKKDEVHVENKRNSENFHNLNILSPTIDTRRSSWSVADRIKQVEDLKWTENKGYSTKVNFGDGEATVVENRHPTWPRRDEYSKDSKKNLLNKGLVVRIGRTDTNSTHTVCSKTTTNCDTNGTTTTTKITIDLTPSPTNESDFKFPRVALQNFKSPSLIMNTIKHECYNTEVLSNKIKVSPHLEVLRKLYEDHSDSEADKEVHQILMSSKNSSNNKKEHHDSGSVVSGSWSKMRAFKQVSQYQKSFTRNGSHVLLEKDANSRLTPEKDEPMSKFQQIDEQIAKDLNFLNQEADSLSSPKYSPVVLRKSNATTKSAFTNTQKLSSPFLVQNRSRNNSYNSDSEFTKTFEQNMKNIQETIKENVERGRSKSPTKVIVRNKSPAKEQVLRQPKKSEMAYFGIDVSPKPLRNNKLTEKPDLLQFNSIDEKKTKIYAKRDEVRAPIYENLDRKANKFDSSILEELTKAADQILLAVNGYTDEEYHKYSTDDERAQKRETLDTISETKSWKQTKIRSTQKVLTAKTTKLKPTSSNSSIDSISRETKKVTTPITRDPKKPFMTKSAEQKQRQKVVAAENTVKSATKARRLQRASSREALLQSHGSSSEDITTTIEVVRKPRLVKKTKTTQLTMTNGFEMKKPSGVKKRDEIKAKHDERVPVIGLPEIRHKTAVSTIRSTAEKQASRDKVKVLKSDDKKRYITKRTDTKGTLSSTTKSEKTSRSAASHRDATPTHRLTSSSTVKKSTRTEGSSFKH